MRSRLLVAVLAACGSSSDTRPAAENVPAETKPKQPPDEMDERMRHCPLALEGATSILEDIEGGVRFTITPPEATVEEARRRAHHIVEFAAKKTREGHGGFDGKGGGRMKNCPVVTDDVSIAVKDIPRGTQIDVIARGDLAQLRSEARSRAEKFPFVGATITIAAAR
jgi:hypothetical protein